MTWRVIESAPRDGTKIILVCRQCGEMSSGFWWDNGNKKNPRARWVWDGFPARVPSHWKPMPKRPK